MKFADSLKQLSDSLTRLASIFIQCVSTANQMTENAAKLRSITRKMTQSHTRMNRTPNNTVYDPHRANRFKVSNKPYNRGWHRTRSNPTLCPKQKRKYLKRNRKDDNTNNRDL